MAASAVVVVVAGLMAASTASASDAGTVSDTQVMKNVVIDQEPTTNPCTGAAGELTLTAASVIAHVTTNANGFWATFTATGAATFVATDPSQPSGSGHFTAWDGENGNLKNGTETATFSVRVAFSDGSMVTMHEVAHMSFSANGINSISFDKPRMTCG